MEWNISKPKLLLENPAQYHDHGEIVSDIDVSPLIASTGLLRLASVF